ncbi:MAG: DUF1275 family protein [Phycisphaerales bacterium]
MPRLTLAVPSDYVLARDACSYGYFLLAPNYWHVPSQTLWRVIELPSGPVRVGISQPADRSGWAAARGKPLSLRTDKAVSKTDKPALVRQITRMLRLDEPAETLKQFHTLDKRWKRTGAGRMFRSPTMWEDVVKTITSCNVAWPNTMTMNMRLCEVMGTPVPGSGDAAKGLSFPTPEKIADQRPLTLRARCRVGYRDGRIVELAKMFTKGEINPAWFEDPATPDEAVREALIELPGIGPYAAHNIMQLLGRYGHLPFDSESMRHARTILGYTGPGARCSRSSKPITPRSGRTSSVRTGSSSGTSTKPSAARPTPGTATLPAARSPQRCSPTSGAPAFFGALAIWSFPTDTSVGMFVAQAHSFASQARLAITLSWVAGYTNVLCLLIVAHPTSHISGVSSFIGQYAVEPGRYRADIWPLLFVLAAFLIGAGISGALTETGRRRGWGSIYVLPIAVEALLLVAVAIAMSATGLAPLSGGGAMWTILACAAGAMGLQNATITRISAGVVRTTHLTGVATDLGMESAQLLMAGWDRARVRGARRHANRHEGSLSGKRLALLLSIMGSFIFGAALATLLYDHLRWLAVYPPVLFLVWIIFVDSTQPIAEIEPAAEADAGGNVLPLELAVFHVRRDARRKGQTHRLPNLLAWVDRLSDAVRVVVLDLDHVAVLDDNAVMELSVAVDHLTRRQRRLVLAGITPDQYAQLERLGVVTLLDPLSVYADFDLALARGLAMLHEPAH